MLSRVILALMTFSVVGEELTQDALTDQLSPIEAFSGTFQQTRIIAVLPKPLTSSGKFEYRRKTGLDWKIETPIRKSYHFGAGQSADTMPGQYQAIAAMFSALFSGDFSQLEHHFETQLSGELADWQVTLVPKAEQLQRYLTSIVLSGDTLVNKIAVFEVSGDGLLIELYIEKIVTSSAEAR